MDNNTPVGRTASVYDFFIQPDKTRKEKIAVYSRWLGTGLVGCFILAFLVVLSVGRYHVITTVLSDKNEFFPPRINFRQFCLGFIPDDDQPSMHIMQPEFKKYLETTNYTFNPINPLGEHINETLVPHFITLCSTIDEYCITYTSREFCDLLLALGDYHY